MKKLYLLFLSFICLSSLNAFAQSPCDSEIYQQKPQPCETKKQELPSCTTKQRSECFLCTGKNMNSIFTQMNLSETQICTALKIQDKYELEVLSLEEKLQCEKQNLLRLEKNCVKGKELRKQKKLVKELKKKKKEICKCYEDQFKALLSDCQKRIYRKCKK